MPKRMKDVLELKRMRRLTVPNRMRCLTVLNGKGIKSCNISEVANNV